MSCLCKLEAIVTWNHFSFLDFVRKLQNQGWELSSNVSILSTAGDEPEWKTSSLEEAEKVFQDYDQDGNVCGVVIWEPTTRGALSVIVHKNEKKLIIECGADCPKDKVWPRVVDLNWSIKHLKELLDVGELNIHQFQIFVFAP